MICICNTGLVIKRKAGSHGIHIRGGSLNSNWTSSFTNSNVFLPKYRTRNINRGERQKSTNATNNCLVCAMFSGRLKCRGGKKMNKKQLRNTGRKAFYPYIVLIRWCLQLWRQSWWGCCRIPRGSRPPERWDKSPVRHETQGWRCSPWKHWKATFHLCVWPPAPNWFTSIVRRRRRKKKKRAKTLTISNGCCSMKNKNKKLAADCRNISTESAVLSETHVSTTTLWCTTARRTVKFILIGFCLILAFYY